MSFRCSCVWFRMSPSNNRSASEIPSQTDDAHWIGNQANREYIGPPARRLPRQGNSTPTCSIRCENQNELFGGHFVFLEREREPKTACVPALVERVVVLLCRE